MPEEPEIETAELREKIHEEIEREGSGSFLKAIALGAVAALTRNRLVWLLSLGLGASGTVLFAVTLAG